MKTAREVKKIADESFKNQRDKGLNKILERIERQASNGKYELSVYVDKNLNDYEFYIDILKSLGYELVYKIDNTVDIDNNPNFRLSINWKNIK